MFVQPVEHRFAAPAGEICWFEWGQAGTGPTLLLIHATGFHARCWDGVVAALPDDMHIVAPDLRGHGRSYRPATLEDWVVTAADILALVESLPAKPLVAIGHSMGAVIATQLAAMLPDRVARLLLVDPVIMPPDMYHSGSSPPGRTLDEHPVSRRRNVWDSADQMIARFADRLPYSNWRPEILADYCRFGLEPYPHGHHLELACPPRLEASAYLGAARTDPSPIVRAVCCPVTVLRARNAERASDMDFSISPTWPELATQFVDGRDLHWPDVSHFIPMEVPERLAELIVAEVAAEQG